MTGGAPHGRARPVRCDEDEEGAHDDPGPGERAAGRPRRAGLHGLRPRSISGWPTSPMSGPGPASAMRPSSSTPSAAASWAGGSQPHCAPTSRSMPSRWPSGAGVTGPSPGLVHHSDRGSQYLAIRYTERLEDAGVVNSVGSKGDSYDNALAETVNGLYKAELINRRWSLAQRRAGRTRDRRLGPLVEYAAAPRRPAATCHRRSTRPHTGPRSRWPRPPETYDPSLHETQYGSPPAEYEAEYWATQQVATAA